MKRLLVITFILLAMVLAWSAEAEHTDRCTAVGSSCLDIVPAIHEGVASFGSMQFSFKGQLGSVPAGCARRPAKWRVVGPAGCGRPPQQPCFEAEASGDTASLPFSRGGTYGVIVDVPVHCGCTTAPGFFCSAPSYLTCAEYAPDGCGGLIGSSQGIQYPVYEPPVVTLLNADNGVVDLPYFPTVQAVFPHSPTRADWFWGDQKQCVGCNTLEPHKYELPGEYDVTVVFRNPAGAQTHKYKVKIAPDPPTVIWGFRENQTRVAGDPQSFSSTIGGGERGRQILWDFGDGSTSTAEDPTHTFAAADEYLVSLAVTNAWGTTIERMQITIAPKSGGSPPSTANFTFSPASPVTGQLVSFTDRSSGSIGRWRWNFDYTSPLQTLEEATLSYEQNPTHTYTDWGRKNVELWVSNAYGKTGIVLFVDVLRADRPPLAGFTWSPLEPRVGQQVQFTDTSFGATGWLWDFGDGATSTAQHPTHAFTTPGQKAVKLRVTNNYGSDEVTKFFPCHLDGGDQLAANFNWSPLNPRPGEQVSFTDTSTGGPLTWNWTFSDGFQSNVQNPGHAFAAAGQYTVTLRVGKDGLTNETTKTVTVANNAKPAANFNWSPVTPRINQSVSFNDLSSGNPTSFSWNFGDAGASSARNPSHTFTQARSYIVTLTATNEAGSDTISKTVEVVDEVKKPEASFTWSPAPGSAGSPVFFNDTSSGPPESWSWTFGDGTSSSTQHPSHTFPVEGTYSVTLTVRNEKGSDSATNSVSVGPSGKPVADFFFNPASPNVGDTVVFNDASTNSPTNLQWTFGDGGSATGSSVTHTYNQPGTYIVTLTARNDKGSDVKSASISVGVPPALNAAFDVSANDIVVERPVQFTDRSSGTPDSWHWDFGDGKTSTDRNPMHTYVSEGIPEVTLNVTKGNETTSKSQRVSVFAPPVAKFSTSGDPAVGLPVRFNDQSKGPAKSRQWSIGGAVVSTESTFEHTFDAMGEKRVKLEVTNPAGSDSLNRTVTIKERPGDQRPVINKISGPIGPCFFEPQTLLGSVNAPFDLTIDWKNLEPSAVTLSVNEKPEQSFGVISPFLPASAVLDSKFLDYTEPAAQNTLTFRARAKDGRVSDPQELTFFSYQMPEILAVVNSHRRIDEPKRTTYALGLAIPAIPFEKETDIPDWVPIFGGQPIGIKKTQFKAELLLRTDCSMYTSVELGGGFVVLGAIAGLKGTGTSEVTLSQAFGVAQSANFQLGVEGFLGIEREQALIEAVPVLKPACAARLLKPICNVAKAKAEVVVSLGGNWEFTINPDGSPEFSKFLFPVKLQFSVTGSIKALGAEVEAFGGGKGGLAFGAWTNDPFFQKADFGFEVGGKIAFKLFVSEFKEGGACAFEPVGGWACGGAIENSRTPESQAASFVSVRPIPEMSRQQRVEELASGDPVVLRNVSPVADPSAAARADRALIVYVSENASMGSSAQRTDLRSVMATGTPLQWQESRPVTNDGNGDFNPAVVWTSNSTAVAVWERVGNSSLTFSDVTTVDDLSKLAQEMEIAAATYDAASGTWSSVSMLTSNQLYDTSPALATLDDGRAVLVWIRQSADASGAQQVVSRTLQSGSWSAEQIVASDIEGAERLALAAHGTTATLVLAHKDNLVLYQFGNNAWGSRRDITSDTEKDSFPTVLYEGDKARVYWIRNEKLATRILPDGSIELVRDNERSDPVGTVVTAKADGTAILAWGTASDVYARLRDPKSKQWSGPLKLLSRGGTPSSLTSFVTPDGQLQLVGLEREVLYQDVERIIDGQPVTIEDVPTPGRVDIVDYAASLHVDLAAGSLVPNQKHPTADETLTFTATLTNAGRVTVSDVRVELRRGTEAAASTTISGDWLPGESKEVSLSAQYIAASPRFTLVVDPASTTADVQRANNSVTYAFDNLSPRSCLQASVAKGGIPLEVTFDSTCSADVDGTIVSRRWLFGDGQSADGVRVTHTYTEQGTYTATLVISDDAGGTSTSSIEINAGTGEDWKPARSPHALYIPIIGRAAGVGGSFFVTDVSVQNTDAVTPLQLDLVYIPDGRPEFHKRITLQGGEVLQAADVLANVFGASDGAGSLRIDPSHPHLVALARTYNQQSIGTAGFSTNGVRREAALRDGETGTILQHWLPGYRTNIGFTEIDGAEAEITATVYAENGTVLGTEQFRIGPYEHRQFNGLPLFQSRGRIDVAIRGGRVLPYVATVDNRTGDPIYQTAVRRPAGSGPSSLLIPIVGRLRGANNSTWRTDVRVFNPSATSQSVSVELLTGAGVPAATLQLAAGATASFDDVVTALFPQLTGDISGALSVSAAGPVMATSRTFNLASTGTYGLYIPARGSRELLEAGETATLLQVQENEAYRCNLGLASFDTPGAVRVRAFDENGRTLATKIYNVGARQNLQFGRVVADMGVSDPSRARGLEVTVREGTLFVYASIIDNRSGDATFVEAGR